jgi:hypothetical protein
MLQDNQLFINEETIPVSRSSEVYVTGLACLTALIQIVNSVSFPRLW